MVESKGASKSKTKNDLNFKKSRETGLVKKEHLENKNVKFESKSESKLELTRVFGENLPFFLKISRFDSSF